MFASVALSVPAFAQQTAAADQGPSGGTIEEIVVTAERKSESIMSVPATIQAATIEQLNNQGIHNLTDLELVTPNYMVADSSAYTMIFIRGIGNNTFVGPESNVATYVDDVPRLWGQFENQFVDVARVEVLKGAQGGLYGRNATGGVVNTITMQPSTDEFSAIGRFDYGSYNLNTEGAFVNVPINDQLAFSIAAERDAHDGYIKNVTIRNPYPTNLPAPYSAYDSYFAELNSAIDPHDLDTQNTYGLDAKLLWQPTDNFKITFAGDYYFKSDSGGNQNYTATPAIPESYLTEAGVLAGLPAGLYQYLPTEQAVTGKFETATGDNITQQLHDWGGSMTMVWNTPVADVTSISAYRANHSVLDADLCGCSLPAGTAVVDIARQFYYEELRAVSNTSGPFQWLGGATFLADHQAYNTDFIVAPILNLNTAHAYDLVKNWTVYGQVGYDIWDNLNLTASVRWEHETNAANFPPLPLQPPGGAQQGLDKLIPSATLSYKLEDGSIYARWARGVQSGGVNPVASTGLFNLVGAPLSDGSTFGPEEVDTYEIGYKQSLMDHKLNLTADIFYNRFSNLQESAHATPAYQQAVILAIVNAGNAHTDGAEATITYRPIDPLTVGVNVGYLDAAYLTGAGYGLGVPPGPAQVLTPTPLGHTVLPFAPKWQLSMTADVDQPIDDRFDFVAHVVESYTSRELMDQGEYDVLVGANLPGAYNPSYWITNLRIGVKTNDDKYELDVFANNLFDQAYFTYGSVSAESGELYGWGNPRVIGGELRINY